MFRFFSPSRSEVGQLDLDAVEAVLFDLDGTLIDIDMQRFIPAYLQRLTARLQAYGEPRRIAATIREAVVEMLTCSTGRQTMEDLLVGSLESGHGIDRRSFQAGLEGFLREDLADLQGLITGHPLAADLVDACLENGWQPILATNPIFPRAVVEARLAWGGLDRASFHLVTAYETARYCKPQAGYFREVLAAADLPARACLMVGNDTEHDLAAGAVGLQTCLLSTWRIDRLGGRYRTDWEGSHEDLLRLFQGRETRPRSPQAGSGAN